MNFYLKALIPLSLLILSACSRKSEPDAEHKSDDELQVISVVPNQDEKEGGGPTITKKGDGVPAPEEPEAAAPDGGGEPDAAPDKAKGAAEDSAPTTEEGAASGAGGPASGESGAQTGGAETGAAASDGAVQTATTVAKPDAEPASGAGEDSADGATSGEPGPTTTAAQEPAVEAAAAAGAQTGATASGGTIPTETATVPQPELGIEDQSQTPAKPAGAAGQTETVEAATESGASVPEEEEPAASGAGATASGEPGATTEAVSQPEGEAAAGGGESEASADVDAQTSAAPAAEDAGAALKDGQEPAESDTESAESGESESAQAGDGNATAPVQAPAGEKTSEAGGDDPTIKQLKSTGVISDDYDERLNYYTVAYLVHHLGQAHKMLKYLKKENLPFSESVKTEIINLISPLCYDALCRRIDFSRLDREKVARFIGYTGMLMASDADIKLYHSGWGGGPAGSGVQTSGGPDSGESGAKTDAGVSAARAMLSESPYLIPDPREKPALVPAGAQGSFEPLAVLHSSTVNSQNPLHTRQFIESMKGRRIKALAINLPSPRALPSDNFLALGEFIKKEGVGLHIIGTCAAACAHYLLPAAHYVHIGPYGHISLYGSAGGFRRDIQSVLPLQAAFTESGRTESAVPALFNQIVNSLKVQAATGIPAGSGPNFDLFQHELHETLRIAQKTIPGAAEHPERVLLNVLINRWGGAPGNDGAAIVQAFQRSAESRGLNHILEAEPGLYREIFAALSPHELKTLKKFVFDASHAARRQQGYVQALAAGEAAESAYFQKINAPGLFVSLLDLTSGLIRNDYYLNGFFTPRFFFNIPEEEKPWVKTVPSADMLRHVGLKGVRGENHAEMFAPFGLSKDPEGTGLALNPENIERCNFLTSEGAADFRSWNEEDLNNCLFAN